MNPFRNAIAANPWDETSADVSSIHRSVFDACLQGIDTVRRNRRSGAILIHGEAGSGKTHLLSRLRAQLAPRAAAATDRPESMYVWVRLQTSPRMIWRTVRRTLVDDWFRPVSGHPSQFERILFHRLAEIRVANGDLEPWYEYMLDEHPAGLQELMEQIATNLDLDRNTAVAFEHIAFRRHKRDLRAWLAGASLPEAALTRMDLSLDEGTDEEREDQARQVVLMLCRLAGNDLPIVLCFDQVEALQLSPRDLDGPFAFGQMVSTVHDSTQNALVVSCVQSAFVDDLQQVARGANYARISSLGALSLQTLDAADAKQLISARLQSTQSPVPARVVDSSCWPLDPTELAELVGKGDLTPRKLLCQCADRYDSWLARGATEIHSAAAPSVVETGGVPAAPSRKGQVPSFLDDKWRTSVEQKLAGNSADLTEEIVRHGLPLLTRLAVPDQQPVKDELLREVPLLFEGPKGRTGISVRTESNMNSLNAKFGNLAVDLASNRLTRLVIVRDSRRALSKGAKVTQKKLDDLQQHGAIVVFPSAEVLAALDALRDLLSDAKSGDLECDGETVGPQTVEEWLTSHLDGRLQEFVRQVFGTDAVAADASHDVHDVEALNTLLAQSPILPLSDVAAALQKPADAILKLIRRHSDQFALLGEPPQVLFRVVETSDSTE